MSPCNQYQTAIDAHLFDPDTVDLSDEAVLHMESCDPCMAHFESKNPPWEDFPVEGPLASQRRALLLESVDQRSSPARFGFGVLIALAVAATLFLALVPDNEESVVEEVAAVVPAQQVDLDAMAEMGPQEMLNEAVRLAGEGDYDQALDLLDGLLEIEDLDPSIASRAERFVLEYEVIGSPAGDLSTVEWLVDSATLEGDALTMLIFFEEWCPHCKREMPKAEETYKRHKADGLRVVGLTKGSRTGVEAVTQYVDEAGYSFPIGLDIDSVLSDRFSVRGVPAAVLVDGGEVVWRGHPARLTAEMLEDFLDQ